ncbi:hypothetical protein LINPERHAP1_LOCUS34832 [Linum perenne]
MMRFLLINMRRRFWILQDLLRRDWEVHLLHVFKEGNRAADFLAYIGFNFPLGVHSIPYSDVNLGFHLHYDWLVSLNFDQLLLND